MVEVLDDGRHELEHIGSCTHLGYLSAVFHHAAFTYLGGSDDGECFGFAYAIVA